MGGPVRQLEKRELIAYALGSLAGPGLLFLPSAVYVMVGEDALAVTILTAILAIPLFVMFTDLVKISSDGRGVEGFVHAGLGPAFAATVPVMMLAATAFAFPTFLNVAGDYIAAGLGRDSTTSYLASWSIFLIAFIANVLGVQVGSGVQKLVSFAMIAFGAVLVASNFGALTGGVEYNSPNFEALGDWPQAIVLAFFAWFGMENLSFITGDAKNPEKDFVPAMAIAFVIYGLLVFALTATYAAVIGTTNAEPSPILGLFQLADNVDESGLTVIAVAALAYALSQAQNNSWIFGMSRMISSSAQQGALPRFLGVLNAKGLPLRALLAMCTIIAVNLAALPWWKEYMLIVLAMVSNCFLLVYVLTLLAHLVLTKSVAKRLSSGLTLCVLVGIIVSHGIAMAYSLGIFFIALVLAKLRFAKAAKLAKA